ncbi:hypothetical protein [Agromyces sp. SYSU T00266]|uniref:hypothetical protein n=1 Tax=Agromyces zhanjiangensis TaxID=3158562 RepID=UPI00339456E9
MTTTTHLPPQPSAPAEPDEAGTRRLVDDGTPSAARVRDVVDETATRPPVEVLIDEAKHRARRRRLAIGGVAAAVVTVAAISVTATLGGAAPPDAPGAALSDPVGETALGMFEPMRGRIVWAADGELRAVDPADPTDVRRVALPDEVDSLAMVSGWSADGTRLALTSEDAGRLYVLDARGTVDSAGGTGCCLFVSEPWLAPDGVTVAEFVAPGRLQLRDVSGLMEPRHVDVDPVFGSDDGPGILEGAWSPDGTRIARWVYEDEVTWTRPSIHVLDLATGTTRELLLPEIDFIRHATWSPDGKRLLIVAGWYLQENGVNLTGPPIGPQNTSLYVIDTEVDASGAARAPEPIATSHFIAATWAPGGEQIAAIDHAGGPGGHGIVIMNRDGTNADRIVQSLGTRAWTGLAWHPNPGPAQ